MFLKRLLRRRTDVPVAVDQSRLIDTALNASDSAARREACHALADLAILRRMAEQDPVAGIRDLADARYRNLLCGLDAGSPPLPQRLDELGRQSDQALLAQVAVRATDAELRRAAIDRLEEPLALADCAVDDALAANRLIAVERLHDREGLERVLQRIGKRDTRVYRLARQRLKEMKEREERPQLIRTQGEALCERLERLGRFDNWVQDQALLGHIDQQWAQLEPEADDILRARYRQLRQAFVDAYDAYAEEHAAQIAEAEARAADERARKALISELNGLAETAAADAAEASEHLRRRISEIEQAWGALAVPGGDAILKDYRAALAAARERRSELEHGARRAAAAAGLLTDAKALLAHGGELDRKQVGALRQRLERLEQGSGDQGIVRECGAALEQLEHRLEKHREQVARKLAALPERLKALDEHFEHGRLKKAEPLYQSIAATLEQARRAGLPRKHLAPAETHLKDIAPQLRELQRWRRWGADTKRQTLCEEIEALAADEAHELEPLANRLQELRDAWRALDRGGAPADDALWTRFHAAAERINERCQPFFESQAKIRKANREQREALCERLETFLDQADWERMDWKKAARAEREMRRAWSALGPPDGRQHRPLEGRFHRLLRRLDRALDEERARNRAWKEDLIAGMQNLADEPDLRRAIESAKELQQRWQTTVPGRQRDENALWKTFRSASDAVFARRAAEQEARSAELRENQATREAICGELETLVAGAPDAARMAGELRALESRWADTEGLAVPRQAVQPLQRRWRQGLARARDRLRHLEAEAVWAAIERLEKRSRYCDQIARQLVEIGDGANGADAGALREQWQGLQPIDDGDAARRMDQAFDAIAAAATDETARDALRQSMTENARHRLDLCLQLEITAGTESPPELQQQRMEMQVQRLRGRMGDGEPDPVADASKLLREWYLCVPAAAAGGLEARFERTKQRITRVHPETDAAAADAAPRPAAAEGRPNT